MLAKNLVMTTPNWNHLELTQNFNRFVTFTQLVHNAFQDITGSEVYGSVTENNESKIILKYHHYATATLAI